VRLFIWKNFGGKNCPHGVVMVVASLSPEQKILDALRGFGCSIRDFAEISGVIGRTRLSEGLSGTPGKNLDQNTMERLFDCLDRMQSLQSAVNDAANAPVMIDFSKTERIVNALVVRLVAQCDQTNHSLDQLVESTTKSVTQ
jgi:hypothetical protein